MGNKIHVWRDIQFASFINIVMWNRANTRVWAGPMGLCFSWQGANRLSFAAFQSGKDVHVYRAGGVWPPSTSDLCPTRRERQERLGIGRYSLPRAPGGIFENQLDYRLTGRADAAEEWNIDARIAEAYGNE